MRCASPLFSLLPDRHTAHIAHKTHIAHAHCTCTRHTRTAHEYCTCTPHIRAHTQTLRTQHCVCTLHTHHKCTPTTNTADIRYTHTALTFAHKTFPTHIAHARINAHHTCAHMQIAHMHRIPHGTAHADCILHRSHVHTQRCTGHRTRARTKLKYSCSIHAHPTADILTSAVRKLVSCVCACMHDTHASTCYWLAQWAGEGTTSCACVTVEHARTHASNSLAHRAGEDTISCACVGPACLIKFCA